MAYSYFLFIKVMIDSSELNMIFLLRKESSKEISKLIGESNIVVAERKKPIKGNIKGDPKSSKKSQSVANCFQFQCSRVEGVLGTHWSVNTSLSTRGV